MGNLCVARGSSGASSQRIAKLIIINGRNANKVIHLHLHVIAANEIDAPLLSDHYRLHGMREELQQQQQHADQRRGGEMGEGLQIQKQQQQKSNDDSI